MTKNKSEQRAQTAVDSDRKQKKIQHKDKELHFVQKAQKKIKNWLKKQK